MSRSTNKFNFTQDKLRRLTPAEKVQRYYDEKVHGLFLQVTPNGVRTFYFMYANPELLVETKSGVRKKSSQLKLGRYPTLSIEDARKAASEKAALVARGIDPIRNHRERVAEVQAEESLAKLDMKLTLEFQLDNDESAWRQYTRREKLKRVEDTVKILKHHFGHWLQSPMSSVKREQLQGWIEERIRNGASPGAINRPLAYYASVYRRCRLAHPEFSSDPFEGLQKPREKTTLVRYFTDEERERFTEALELQPEYFQILVFTLWRTGARKNEILGSRWHQIEKRGDRHYMKLTDTKNGEERLLPLPAGVFKALSAWRLSQGLKDRDWLFPSPRVQGVRLTSIQKQWAKLLDDAKIETFRVHDLRHDFATSSLANGTPPHVLQRILGHKDLATTLGRYGHVTPEEMHDAVDKLGRQ